VLVLFVEVVELFLKFLDLLMSRSHAFHITPAVASAAGSKGRAATAAVLGSVTGRAERGTIVADRAHLHISVFQKRKEK
jgi:hypothetical protein